jgi:hypothetical protein
MSALSEHDFRKIYSELGLVKDTGEIGNILRESCMKSHECWRALNPVNDDFGISNPWIGKQYHLSRILVLGINMNKCGNWNACSELVELARAELHEGKYKHFIQPNYRGTLFYYRIAHLGTAISQIMKGTFSGRVQGEAKDVAEGFDWVSYTNQIKCSPQSKRSKPSEEMWQNCGAHILRKELNILLPQIVIIFGRSDNYYYFCNRVFDKDSIQYFPDIDLAHFAIGNVNGRRVKILAIPHPSAINGRRDETYHSVHNSLYEIMRDQ